MLQVLISQWNLTRDKNQLKSGDPDYHANMVRVFKRNASAALASVIGGWSTVNEINAIVSFLDSYPEALMRVHDFYNEHVLLSDTVPINNADVLKIFYTVKQMVTKHVADRDHHGSFWAALVRFGFPTAVDAQQDPGRCSTWLFRKPGAEFSDTGTNILKLSMSESKVVAQLKQAIEDGPSGEPEQPADTADAAADAADANDVGTPGPTTGRRRKAVVSKVKAKKHKKQRVIVSVPLDELTFSDDVSMLARACTAGLLLKDRENEEKITWPVVSRSMDLGFLGQAKYNGVEYSKWSDLREKIESDVQGNVAAQPPNADDISEMLMRDCVTPSASGTLVCFDGGDDSDALAKAIHKFSESNNVMLPVRLHSAARGLLEKLHTDKDVRTKIEACTSHKEIVDYGLSMISSVVPTEWGSLGTRLAFNIARSASSPLLAQPNVAQLLSSTSDTPAFLEKLVRLRGQYFMDMMQEVSQAFKSSANLLQGLQFISTDKIAAADASASTSEQQSKLWCMLLKSKKRSRGCSSRAEVRARVCEGFSAKWWAVSNSGSHCSIANAGCQLWYQGRHQVAHSLGLSAGRAKHLDGQLTSGFPASGPGWAAEHCESPPA